ncbi:MAG: sulfotransferase family protein [Gammaproteobacteria bacterium]
MNPEVPVFLVGSERSGTTLFRLMLDHHPEIAFNLESEYLVSQISSEGVFPNIQEYRTFLLNDRVFKHSKFKINDRLDYVELAHDFLEQKRKRAGKLFVGATVHHQFSKLKLIWPNAKYIHILRDGRDVANSVVQMGWAGNPYVAAEIWLEAENEWDILRESLATDAWLEIKYEELTAMPSEQLIRVCEFIGVDFSEKMFDYINHSSYAFPKPALNYQWKKKSRRNIQLMENKLGDRLVSRGYSLSGFPKINVTKIHDKVLRFQSRIYCFCFRFQRYGMSLALLETITRRLRLYKANQKINKQIDGIIDLYLK